MAFCTTDLCDAHGDRVRVVEPMLRDFGGVARFSGPIVTVRAPEDNSLVRAALEEPGQGRVLVVDGGASMRCALLGDQLAVLARDHGWAGVVIYGCVRDSEALSTIAIGVRALATMPRKSNKKGRGERDVPITFGGVTFTPGEWLYADADGIVVSAESLT
jgi:regulator of ribonuclease activity A